MPAKRRPITIADIARQVGVSHQVVSMVLQRADGRTPGTVRVSAPTAQRIREAAGRLGYRPNAAALSMRSRRHQRVALLLSTLPGRSYMPEGFLEALHDGLAAVGLDLALHRIDDERLADAAYVPGALRRWSCDALVINYSVAPPPQLYDLVTAHQIPAIWVNRRFATDSVVFADRAAGAEAARRIAALGHRQIGWFCIVGDGRETPTGHDSQVERLCGFREALADIGLTARLLTDRDARWLDEPGRPTAVACYASIEACLLIVACLRRGLRIPADLSLLAICEGGPHDTLELSRMELDGTGLGSAAAVMVRQALEDGASPQTRVEVPLPFVPGSSLGLPPS